MAATITIGCKLPNGITLDTPVAPGVSVTLKGANKELIINSGYGTTEVDAKFWEAWKSTHAGFQPLTSGAIFEAKSQNDAAAIAREQTERKTGLERMPQKAMGVKKVEAE